MARQKGTWAEENDGCPRFAVLYCEIGHGSGDSRRFTGEFLELLANSGVSWRTFKNTGEFRCFLASRGAVCRGNGKTGGETYPFRSGEKSPKKFFKTTNPGVTFS